MGKERLTDRETNADRQIDKATFEREKRDTQSIRHRARGTEMHRPDKETQKRGGQTYKQTDRLSQRGRRGCWQI